jgi:hypothetical protein
MPEESSSKDTDGGAGIKESGSAGKKSGGTGNQNRGFAPKTLKFKGKCTDLKGHIYDCTDVRQSEQYTKTTKEIAENVGWTYSHLWGRRQASC